LLLVHSAALGAPVVALLALLSVFWGAELLLELQAQVRQLRPQAEDALPALHLPLSLQQGPYE
jgi:hypothetical protein